MNMYKNEKNLLAEKSKKNNNRLNVEDTRRVVFVLRFIEKIESDYQD